MAGHTAARDKVHQLPELLQLLQRRRSHGETVVCTNGHFDLLHIGHLRALEYAAALGNILVVGVNDDASVRALKPNGRPLVPAAERAELLAALACVDYVVVFAETTAERLLEELRPEVYVKGADYSEETLPEAHVIRAYGGRIALAPLVPDHSTSDLERRIRRATDGESRAL